MSQVSCGYPPGFQQRVLTALSGCFSCEDENILASALLTRWLVGAGC